MILKNNKGMERNFRVLFEIESKENKYLVYEDINTLNIYGGRVDNEKLLPLSNEEFEFLNNMLGKISG